MEEKHEGRYDGNLTRERADHQAETRKTKLDKRDTRAGYIPSKTRGDMEKRRRTLVNVAIREATSIPRYLCVWDSQGFRASERGLSKTGETQDRESSCLACIHRISKSDEIYPINSFS